MAQECLLTLTVFHFIPAASNNASVEKRLAEQDGSSDLPRTQQPSVIKSSAISSPYQVQHCAGQDISQPYPCLDRLDSIN